jgi:clan AA aspartic protease
MITGTVNDSYEATVRLAILGAGGVNAVVEALLDTGFSGALTLPLQVLESLGIERVGSDEMVLADGNPTTCGVYRGTLDWEGEPRTVIVHGVDAQPMIGMALLADHELRVRVTPGGSVSIQRL